MSRSFPFIQRRGFALHFRIAVPGDLRALIGLTEVTKALKTSDKRVAAPAALAYAAHVKRAYSLAREATVEMDEDKLKALMAETKLRLRLDERDDLHAEELDAQRTQHRADLAQLRLKTENDTLRRLLAAPRPVQVVSPAPVLPAAPGPQPRASSPQLSKVVGAFLAGFPKKKAAAMFKKHGAVLPLMLDVVGDKPVHDLRQTDLNRFFALVQKLPPRWSDLCRQRGIKPAVLAEEVHIKTMAPKTFEDTYKACVRSFLRDARVQWQDEGFPVTLTTEGISYSGTRKPGENKQRGFTDNELVRLFGGEEMKLFAAQRDLENQFWLPQIGLHTGARVNEICQLNPQIDIRQEVDSGIWHFMFDQDTDGDERITKSVKNETSKRKVPIHSRLLSLGLLGYVDRVKASGAKLLFPAWKPSRGRASSAGEKWFRDFIVKAGLRDDTAGARLVGMHAFRSTLLERAFNSTPPLDATSITGHAGKVDAVVRNYQGELSLTNKQQILEAIDFGI